MFAVKFTVYFPNSIMRDADHTIVTNIFVALSVTAQMLGPASH